MYLLTDNLEMVIAVLLLITVGLVVFSIYLYSSFRGARRVYLSMLKGLDKENLEDILAELNHRVVLLESSIREQQSQIGSLERRLRYATQGVGIVRFNAFNDVGGELSFALAMLDAEGTGFVMSSVFGRSEARVYAKPVKQGVASHALSKEEEQAISRARGSVI